MRSILTMACGLSLAISLCLANDETLLSEAFETFPPQGWELLENGNDGVGWQGVSGTTPACDWGVHSGTNCAWHDDEDDPGMQDDWLITPVLAVPAAATNVTLTFWERNCHVAGYYWYHGLLYSMNGGDWTEVAQFDDRRDEWTQVIVDATAAAGSEIRFAWRYQGAWATEWFMDDVTMVASLLTVAGEPVPLPRTIALREPYPNPFNSTAQIPFELSAPARVELNVYNLLGQKVATLVNPQEYMAGRHQVAWDASDVTSGLYFVKLTSGGNVQSKKLLLVK